MGLSQVAPLFGILGLLMALGVYRSVVAQPSGGGLMIEIAGSIHSGAVAFIRKDQAHVGGRAGPGTPVQVTSTPPLPLDHGPGRRAPR